MAPTKSPAFQFYAQDFLTGTASMSLQEVGAYIRLLAHQWHAGSIPAEPRERARILGCAKAQEVALWKVIVKKFVLRDENYVNERLEDERRKQMEFRRRQSDRGRLGGRPSKAGGKPEESRGFVETKAGANPDKSSSVFSLQSSKNSPRSDERFDAWWKAYPKKDSKGAAIRAWSKIKPDTDTVTKMLEALKWQRNLPQWTKDDGQFIPNPATYLNARKWEDEPFFTPATERLESAPEHPHLRKLREMGVA